MASLFRTLFFWTLVVLTSALAVANRGPVRLSFDPFSSDAPAVAFDIGLAWIILGAVLIGLVLGGWSSWLAQAPLRQAMRDAEDKIRRLEREVEVAQTIIVKPSESRALDLQRA